MYDYFKQIKKHFVLAFRQNKVFSIKNVCLLFTNEFLTVLDEDTLLRSVNTLSDNVINSCVQSLGVLRNNALNSIGNGHIALKKNHRQFRLVTLTFEV